MNRPTTKSWFLVNVFLPLLPFLSGGLIRCMVTLRISWNTFSASEMAICLALLSFFINQSLVRCDPILNNEDKKRDLETEAGKYLIIASFCLMLFVAMTILDSLGTGLQIPNLEISLHIGEVATFLFAPFVVFFSIQTQRSYRLKASLS